MPKASYSARAFERAKNAVFILRDSQSELSEQDQETLDILIDKELMGRLRESLYDARHGNTEPLESILD